MTNQKTLELALNALKHLHPTALTSFYTIGNRDKAIKALEEALAKQEHPIERNFCERCGKRAFDGIHTCTPPAKQEQREQDEFLLRGVLASELKCWHRLTADESQNLIDFVKNMGAKQEQGEPVGYIASMALNDLRDGIYGEIRVYHEELGGSVPIYTTPQQRTWVGLTDEEVEEIWGEDLCVMYSGNIEATKAIEAKLKEKNT
jgi:hypothetical protein